MKTIPLPYSPDQELGTFLNVLVRQCSFLEKTGRTCAYFGFSPKVGHIISPVVFRIGQPKSTKHDVHLIEYAKVKLHALYENPHLLTTYEMDGQEFHGHGEIVVGGGLSLPNYYVSAAAFPREWNEVMAYLFGCCLEARAQEEHGYSWLSNAVDENFGLFADVRVAEVVVRRGVLARVLPEMRKMF